ncbi:MAG: GntR family transcriptional regulator [Lentisphaerae bacterium]|nr:GntR family transcriptional regulator [Lentisphaerota bacterium]
MISEKIYRILKKRIADGIYAPGSRFPSEDTLLLEFSVSKVTINKIVSKLVNEELLVRGVRGAGTRVAQQIFRPAGHIAFIGKLNAFTMEILRGVQKECLHQHLFPVVFSPEADELTFCLSTMNKKNVLGIITVGYGIIKTPDGLPTVCLDYNLPHQLSDESISFISSDNFSGGKNMIREVLKRGHREIAIFSSERFVLSKDAPVAPRISGFYAALQEAGYSDFAERTFYGMPNSLPDAKNCLSSILDKYPNVSIICTDSDHSAELLHKAAKSMNISCPGKIALTGFGNVSNLEIASVNQHPDRQGQLAVRRIVTLQNNNAETNEKDVETELTGIEFIPIFIE